VTRGEDRHHPAGTDTPLEDGGHDAKDEDRQNAVDNAVDPKRAGDEHEDGMSRQMVDVGTRKPQDRVMIPGVEHAKRDAAGGQQRYVDERERGTAPSR
jgi:hypothetical protein